MARGRARNQKGRVTLTGSWQIGYYVYLTDPVTKRPKRHHRARIVGRKPAMRKADAEEILRQELGIVSSSPSSRLADGTITFGEWMRNVYIPMRGANWRDATARSNHDYLDRYIYPVFGHVALNDITKFSVQMLLNKMAKDGYSYWVVYHTRPDQGRPGRGGRSGRAGKKCCSQNRSSGDRRARQTCPTHRDVRAAAGSHRGRTRPGHLPDWFVLCVPANCLP
jgi:hypothetical protein